MYFTQSVCFALNYVFERYKRLIQKAAQSGSAVNTEDAIITALSGASHKESAPDASTSVDSSPLESQ